MEFLQPFDQQLSLIHDAHIHLPNLIVSAKTEKANKAKIDMAEMAVRTGISSNIEKYRPYELVGNVAVINVRGVLLHNYNWSGSYATGYPVIQNKIKAIIASVKSNHKEVKGTLIKYHSPGGTVFGCADTADLIRSLAEIMPVWSLSVDMNLSAAQWLAAQGTRRLGTQSSQQGSVGVIIPRLDYSDYLKEMGIKVDYIFSGKCKADGDPYSEMPADVRAKYQAKVDKMRNEFATAVATGTGMSLDAVIKTEAEIYQSDESVEIGLLDEVVSPHYIEDEFNEHLASSGKIITLGETTAMDPEKEETQASQSQIDEAVAAERTRVTGIMGLPEAKGREELATKLAAQPSISVEAAKEILESSPTAQTQPEEEEDNEDAAAQALAAIGKETGSALQSSKVDDQKDEKAQRVDKLASAYRG
ncbi:putative signal peptide peptidase [Vibrio phage ST2-1pr]|uniref:S49 family peptidase n=1 Tax=Vibrio sp. St2 TaxID=2853441 RepID=UPI001C777A6F|nr:S49 family peptidase [Vibrio sp. St2]QXM18753.1 putative signal peptide peptidase [Vibrio phage ST2-1pr]